MTMTAGKIAPQTRPNNLEHFWMPFTNNRQFKKTPRMVVGAKGMHYFTDDGRTILDATAGLWCCNAGHGQEPIVKAIQDQAAELDYIGSFQFGHPKAFEFAARIAEMAPGNLDSVFFTNSGSESVDTALKIAIAYQRARGQGTRTRLIGRERAYHGVGFGGISVGGIVRNRMYFGSLLTGVDHICHTHDIKRNAFTKGQPEHGGLDFAADLERVIALHDASTIAAVIVEPVSGSTGVLIPPKGYLEKLREICTKHGILLIFDEVITGFGRLGDAWAADHFGVIPDIITCAKGMTSGVVPAGAVICAKHIYDTMLETSETPIEFFHGYTYSGHPLACAAGLATLDFYRDNNLFQRGKELAPYWEQALHSLKGLPHVIDIRNIGMIGAIELEPIPGKPTARAFDAFLKAWDRNLMIRVTSDIIALSPPLIIEKSDIDKIIDTLSSVLKEIA